MSDDVSVCVSVTPEQHRILAASFLWQPRPELQPDILHQLATNTGLEEAQIMVWTRRMRKRLNLGRFVKDLESEMEEMEEENVPDGIRQSGIEPLYYIAPTNRDKTENRVVRKNSLDDLESLDISVNPKSKNNVNIGEDSAIEEINNKEKVDDIDSDNMDRINKDVDIVNVQENMETMEDDVVTKSPEGSLSLVYTDEDLEADNTSAEARQANYPENVVKEEVKKLSLEEKANQYETMRTEIDEMKAKYEALFNMLTQKKCPVPQINLREQTYSTHPSYYPPYHGVSAYPVYPPSSGTSEYVPPPHNYQDAVVPVPPKESNVDIEGRFEAELHVSESSPSPPTIEVESSNCVGQSVLSIEKPFSPEMAPLDKVELSESIQKSPEITQKYPESNDCPVSSLDVSRSNIETSGTVVNISGVLDEASVNEEDYMPNEGIDENVHLTNSLDKESNNIAAASLGSTDLDASNGVIRSENSTDALIGPTDDTAAISFLADFSQIVNSTTNSESNEEYMETIGDTSVRPQVTCEVIEPNNGDLINNPVANIKVEKPDEDVVEKKADLLDLGKNVEEIDADEIERKELAMEAKLLQEEQIRLKREKENFKLRLAELKRKQEAFKERQEEKMRREKAAKEEAERIRREARLHQEQLRKAQEAEEKRLAHVKEVEARREAHRKRMEEERERKQKERAKLQLELMEKKRLEEEMRVKKAEMEKMKEEWRKSKVSRRDLHKNLNKRQSPSPDGGVHKRAKIQEVLDNFTNLNQGQEALSQSGDDDIQILSTNVKNSKFCSLRTRSKSGPAKSPQSRVKLPPQVQIISPPTVPSSYIDLASSRSMTERQSVRYDSNTVKPRLPYGVNINNIPQPGGYNNKKVPPPPGPMKNPGMARIARHANLSLVPRK